MPFLFKYFTGRSPLEDGSIVVLARGVITFGAKSAAGALSLIAIT